MARWTEEQERILLDFCERGAEACRDEILRRTGVSRSVSSTQRHASRLGIALTVRGTCPRCGRLDRLNRSSGLCHVCNFRRLEDETRASDVRREVMRSENDPEIIVAKRSYDRARQRALRDRKREGRM